MHKAHGMSLQHVALGWQQSQLRSPGSLEELGIGFQCHATHGTGCTPWDRALPVWAQGVLFAPEQGPHVRGMFLCRIEVCVVAYGHRHVHDGFFLSVQCNHMSL